MRVLPSAPTVDVIVTETLHARFLNGELKQFTVLGDVALAFEQPCTEAVEVTLALVPSADATRLTDVLAALAPCSPGVTAMAGAPPGSFRVVVAAQTPALHKVLQYKIADALASKLQQSPGGCVPLAGSAQWSCSDTEASLDVRIKSSGGGAFPPIAITDVKVLVGFGPAGVITELKQVQAAGGSSAYDAPTQRLLYVLSGKQLSAAGETVLTASLATKQALAPVPVHVNFACSGNVTGLRIAPTSKKGQDLVVRRTVYNVKSGVFSFQ